MGNGASFHVSLKQPLGFELLMKGSDGIGNEVAISGIEGSAGDGVFELALNGSDQGFGGWAEVHGCGLGVKGSSGVWWLVLGACDGVQAELDWC